MLMDGPVSLRPTLASGPCRPRRRVDAMHFLAAPQTEQTGQTEQAEPAQIHAVVVIFRYHLGVALAHRLTRRRVAGRLREDWRRRRDEHQHERHHQSRHITTKSIVRHGTILRVSVAGSRPPTLTVPVPRLRGRVGERASDMRGRGCRVLTRYGSAVAATPHGSLPAGIRLTTRREAMSTTATVPPSSSLTCAFQPSAVNATARGRLPVGMRPNSRVSYDTALNLPEKRDDDWCESRYPGRWRSLWK